MMLLWIAYEASLVLGIFALGMLALHGLREKLSKSRHNEVTYEDQNRP